MKQRNVLLANNIISNLRWISYTNNVSHISNCFCPLWRVLIFKFVLLEFICDFCSRNQYFGQRMNATHLQIYIFVRELILSHWIMMPNVNQKQLSNQNLIFLLTYHEWIQSHPITIVAVLRVCYVNVLIWINNNKTIVGDFVSGRILVNVWNFGFMVNV